MSDYGLLSSVTATPRGSFLTADAAISDTELLVEYGGDFDNEGGTLDLNGARLDYTSVIDGAEPGDADTLVLAEPLVVAADAEDTVSVVAGGQIVVDVVAQVSMGDGDDVHVPISVYQRAAWSIGIYDPPVPVVVSDDMLHLEDAPGRIPIPSIAFCNTDYAIAVAPGGISLRLSYVPIEGSLVISWNGIAQPAREWTLSGQVVEFIDARVKVDDELTADVYAYDPGASPAAEPSGPVTFRAVTTAQLGFADRIDFDAPATIEAGDRILVFASHAATIGSTLDAVTGPPQANAWTELGRFQDSAHTITNTVVLTKVAEADDAGRTFRLWGADNAVDPTRLVMVVYTASEVDDITHVPVPATWTTALSVPAITASDFNAIAVHHLHAWGTPSFQTLTGPTGSTTRVRASGVGSWAYDVGDVAVPTPTALPALTVTSNPTSYWQAIRLVLRP